jgi:hypothetical protein
VKFSILLPPELVPLRQMDVRYFSLDELHTLFLKKSRKKQGDMGSLMMK